jgi:energy-coupling factor transport system permease protein
MRSGLKYIIIFLAASFIGNMYDGEGRTVIHFLFIDITDTGLYNASINTLQIFSMIVGAKLLILNTSIPDLIDGLGRICRPLKIIRLPVDEFIELMHLTVTALNGITEEIKEKARNRQHKMSKLSQKIDFIVEIVLPILIITIKSPEKIFIHKEQNV